VSTLAEIETAAEKLPLDQQKELIRFLTERVSRFMPAKRTPFRMRTHPGGTLPGIDPGKLAQLAEDQGLA